MRTPFRSRRKRIRRGRLRPFASAKNAMRFLYVNRLYQQVRGIEGALVECGVASGRTLLMMAYAARYAGQERRIVGYDTFAGLPDASAVDGAEARQREGTIQVAEREAWSYLHASGIPSEILSRVTLVRGDVAETLQEYDFGPIALLHVDLDLHAGYRAALNALYPHLAPGGIVMLDEFRDPKWPGATEAIEAFFGAEVEAFGFDPVVERHYYVKPAC